MNPLREFVGTWTGTNSFRLMPADALAAGESSAVTSVEADGWGWALRYTWVHPDDGEQAGMLLVASPADDGSITAAWLDSWHQKPYLQPFSGSTSDRAVTLEAEYAPGWLWQIAVHADEEALRMTMHNVVPKGHGDFHGAYVVMEADWRR